MSDDSMDVVDEESEQTERKGGDAKTEPSNNTKREVYLPSKPLAEGEELTCDPTAYVMLHQAQTGAPCLSFDIIKDNLGSARESYPLMAYIVAGTQASQTHINNIIVMKLHNLHKTNAEDEEDEEDDSDDETEMKTPRMSGAHIKHQGCVNRIRSTVLGNNVLAATWSELGRVNIWNLSKQFQVVDNEQLLSRYNKEKTGLSETPVFTFSGHQQEGFALDWSPMKPGALATGDCKHDIHIWDLNEAGSWKVDQRPLVGHTQSVEDLQWSPNERSVLASCSVDKSIRIWDTRAPPSKACMISSDNAHESDVNVISWNHREPFLISGGDDGYLKIWDLRRFQDKTPVAIFKHHTEPITSVEWHPTDSAVFASSGADNQIALWDLSVEKEENREDIEEDLPPQLLFIHQGQTDIKELHWHPQLPGVVISTAHSGFNIFRTISV